MKLILVGCKTDRDHIINMAKGTPSGPPFAFLARQTVKTTELIRYIYQAGKKTATVSVSEYFAPGKTVALLSISHLAVRKVIEPSGRGR